eukprot:6200451-Pleurochrysis_carterae.AAC.5
MTLRDIKSTSRLIQASRAPSLLCYSWVRIECAAGRRIGFCGMLPPPASLCCLEHAGGAAIWERGQGALRDAAAHAPRKEVHLRRLTHARERVAHRFFAHGGRFGGRVEQESAQLGKKRRDWAVLGEDGAERRLLVRCANVEGIARCGAFEIKLSRHVKQFGRMLARSKKGEDTAHCGVKVGGDGLVAHGERVGVGLGRVEDERLLHQLGDDALALEAHAIGDADVEVVLLQRQIVQVGARLRQPRLRPQTVVLVRAHAHLERVTHEVDKRRHPARLASRAVFPPALSPPRHMLRLLALTCSSMQTEGSWRANEASQALLFAWWRGTPITLAATRNTLANKSVPVL